MNVLKVLLIILMAGCSEPFNVHTEIMPYYDKFQEVTKRYPYRVEAIFTNKLEKDNVAECRYLGFKRRIVILRSFWNSINDYGREQLVFHELGHCLLYLNHENDIKDGCPVSIMYYRAFGESLCYIKNRQKYFILLKI